PSSGKPVSSHTSRLHAPPRSSLQRRHGSLFFFQAQDGIRDDLVTGLQTCALPISPRLSNEALLFLSQIVAKTNGAGAFRVEQGEIGRASCRERVEVGEGAGSDDKS